VPFITTREAQSASRLVWRNRALAESEIRKSAAASMSTYFDIFMSHSFKDAEIIAGIKVLIEETGLTVYVDWIEDAQLDRSQVSAETADILRQRMSHCRFLLYATSGESANSKWMPWELGYFDGLKNGKVGILPIVQSGDDPFDGQEYLGLYRPYELIHFTREGRQIGRSTTAGRGVILKSEM
jgi:hypothetical protein